MFNFIFPLRRTVAVLVLALAVDCQAAMKTDCNDPSSWSTADKIECLQKEYEGASAILQQKVAQLVKIAEPADMATAAKELVEAKRKELQNAIRRSDLLWRELAKHECDTLFYASFGLGNGGVAASLECRIARTYERIKFLSTSEPYGWLWAR